MKAMVLAAGLGTRLRPLTNDLPKALVDVAGQTMLERTLTRLRAFGIHEVIVNVHHYADMVVDYLQTHANFGMRIEISREEMLLDTGGGLKQAAWFFPDSEEPFLVHNVDVLSGFDLAGMIEFHRRQGALATLAVQGRETSRPLLFDREMQLRGRGTAESETRSDTYRQLAFAGIHVLSPRVFGLMEEEGAFSIIDTYLRLSSAGERVVGYREDGAYWRDLGRPDRVAKAAAELRSVNGE